jgi:hypothetical protein
LEEEEFVVNLQEFKENNNLLVDFNFDEGKTQELVQLMGNEFLLKNEALEVNK